MLTDEDRSDVSKETLETVMPKCEVTSKELYITTTPRGRNIWYNLFNNHTTTNGDNSPIRGVQ